MPRVFSYQIRKSPDNTAPARLVFSLVTPPPEKILDEVLKLRREIESANRDIFEILNQLNETDLYDTYLSRLDEALTAGFDSDLTSFALGWYLVQQIHEDFVAAYGSRLRSDYIRKLTYVVLPFGILAFVYGAFLSGPVHDHKLLASLDIQCNIEVQIRTAAWVICGVCASVWLSSVARNRQLQWPRVISLDPDGLSAITRVGLVLAISYVFSLLLKIHVLSAGIGDLKLEMFLDQPSIAVLVGLISGFGGDVFVDMIIGRVQDLAPRRPDSTTGHTP